MSDANAALGEAGKSSLVSGGPEMWRNSMSYHPTLYNVQCTLPILEGPKKNSPLFRALKPLSGLGNLARLCCAVQGCAGWAGDKGFPG